PQGPAQLKVRSFATIEALPRAGLPATLLARVANTGGTVAKNLRATLTLPDGVQAVAAAQPAALAVGEETEFSWKLAVPQPVSGAATLVLAADGADGAPAQATLAFTPRIAVPQTGYVPEPKPVLGPFEVGVYYFPGWHTPERWQPLQGFPERRPVLGWYREGDPEVADWQIKWAVEHGITYFVYDWYWSQGAKHLEHGLHDAYFKSRYHHLLKFCLLWANHNPPKTSSLADCRAVARYWIENYFRRPEHLTVDGKPVMIIFSPHRLSDDLGSAHVKEALDAMRAECRAAGLPGLHLVACVGNASQAQQCAAEGYDAVTAYNWPGLGRTTDDKYAPFETLVPAYRKNWETIRAESPIPIAPLPVCGGWDSRPWHGDNNLVRYGRTPELFKRHLQDAKEFLLQPESHGSKLLLVEAWNEWGEGSYIEPHREFGFGFLDAIRGVFTSAPAQHDDVTPADAGLGPYDLPPPAPSKTAWDFAHGDAAWTHTMGFAEVGVRNGALAGRTSSHDPAFFSPTLQAPAEKFSSVVVRMKLARADGKPVTDKGQLFWRTSRVPESEGTSVHFEINGDGQWHDYTIPLAGSKRWRGTITGLRLDPCNQAGVQVDIASLRLQ
ncbi:MAG: glycoside hydrolase family 99-like domain-containing protein, partial [Kiritimatiellaeota bacterium]|nr:glycoside hydrolase family 99-like domain-containing protein [Kiritimatiellota bacterium]